MPFKILSESRVQPYAPEQALGPANEELSCVPAACADCLQSSATSGIQVPAHSRPAHQQPPRRVLTLKARTPVRTKPPTTPPHAPPPSKPFRKGAWIIGGLAIYSFAAYGFYLYRIYARAAAASQQLQVPENVLDRYDSSARAYDGEVELAEKAMWMGRLRKRLGRKAYGDVLEVSVGTGRNMQYYDLQRCRSVTLLDQSKEMVEVAREKFRGIASLLPSSSS